MQTSRVEDTIGNTLSLGLFLTTIIVISGPVSDPVNTPKLFLLGLTSLAAFFPMLFYFSQYGKLDVYSATTLLFVMWMLISVSQSDSPFSQNIYGVYGRNTGFLAYLFLAIIFFITLSLRQEHTAQRILKAFIIAFGVNVIYSTWVVIFGDFIGWQNIYGSILGTFGNPNFISSFLGMALSVVLAYSLKYKKSKIVLLTVTLVLGITLFLLVKTSSIQGFVIFGSGIAVISFFLLRSAVKSKSLTYLYGGVLAFVGFIGAFGVFNLGPLSRFLYQPTLEYRLEYWKAALSMGKNHPFFGVGMDSYGDWYRRARSAKSLISPGAEVTTNTAHNVPLDLLTYGGIPLLLLYSFIMILCISSAIRKFRRDTTLDHMYLAIFVGWVAYQIQSLISINQIGLAIWGWVFSGLLIGLAKNECIIPSGTKEGHRKQQANEVLSPYLLAGLGLAIGLIVAIPPVSADKSWMSALKNRDANQVEKSLTKSYFMPQNSYRLASAVQLFENAKLPELAHKYALIGTKFNPNYLDAWKMLYYSTAGTSEDKSLAKMKMIKLDPLNTAWRNLP
jgi:O-antigen ligase